jgi:Family of unknown function (DUF6524)
MRTFSLTAFFGRFLAALILVLATYNPSGYSFGHWIAGNFPHIAPLQVVVGIALLALWLFFLHSTWLSLGTVGVVLGLAFLSAVVWLFSTWGWLSLSNHNAITWIALLMIAMLLTFGISWALIRRRVSGQVVVEEVKH